MAQNTIEVNISANTTQLEKTLATLKGKISDVFRANGFSLMELNPWKIAADGIRSAVQYAIVSFRELNEAMAKNGSSAIALGKDLGVTSLEAGRLQEAARYAGVSASEYAEALERIKNGTSSLVEQTEAWERIGRVHSNFTRGGAVINAIAEMQTPGIDDNLNWLQRHFLKASREQQMRVGARMMREVEEGRTKLFTREDVRALGGKGLNGIRVAELVDALNKMISERDELKAAAEKRKEEEQAKAASEAAKAAEALKKKEREEAAKRIRSREAEREAMRKREDDQAKSVYGLWKRFGGEDATGVDRKTLRETLKEAYWLTDKQLDERLRQGKALASTPEAMAEQKLAEAARSRAGNEAELARARGREADLEARRRAVEGDLNAAWLTSSGGSLIGSGSYSLAMANRMRDIDRAEKSAEVVEELRGVKAEIRKLSEKLTE